MSTTEYEPDFFVTAAEKAYQAILQKIIAGEFAPGFRLVRRSLAKMLDMSPIPVLEAMKRLEQDGLIEYKPQWGSIVVIPTEERVRDIFVLREAIECQVARILAKSLSPAQAETLRERAAELDKVRYEAVDLQRINDLHYAFHMMLADFAAYPSLISGLRRANFFWLLCQGVQSRGKRAGLQRDWHLQLVNTILEGDPEAADKAMREHIRDSFVPFMQDLGVSSGEKA